MPIAKKQVSRRSAETKKDHPSQARARVLHKCHARNAPFEWEPEWEPCRQRCQGLLPTRVGSTPATQASPFGGLFWRRPCLYNFQAFRQAVLLPKRGNILQACLHPKFRGVCPSSRLATLWAFFLARLLPKFPYVSACTCTSDMAVDVGVSSQVFLLQKAGGIFASNFPAQSSTPTTASNPDNLASSRWQVGAKIAGTTTLGYSHGISQPM